MRVAIVHDWLTGMRGGERVLEQLIELYPQAELFTLLHVPGAVSQRIESRPITASWIGALPAARRWYRYALPLFPRLIEQFDLRGFDLVISSSHCVAKGARAPQKVPHLCYCHTPMRYLYDQSLEYGQGSIPTSVGLGLFGTRLRAWDRAGARRVTHFIANSEHVRQRIRAQYQCDASVVYPPVAVDRFEPWAKREDYYVTISALVPYKRIDLLIEAFNQSGRQLVIIGTGPEYRVLRSRARSNIRFTGWIGDAEVADQLSRCRGFVFAGTEDFGIALVEAQAAGAPVIAFAAGGALESVIAGGADATGTLFGAQTAHAVNQGIAEAENRSFDVHALLRNARRFAPARFRAALGSQVDAVLSKRVGVAV